MLTRSFDKVRIKNAGITKTRCIENLRTSSRKRAVTHCDAPCHVTWPVTLWVRVKSSFISEILDPHLPKTIKLLWCSDDVCCDNSMWLTVFLWHLFTSMLWMVGRQEEHLTCKNTDPTTSRGFHGDLWVSLANSGNLEKRPFNGCERCIAIWYNSDK